ncbi:zinc-binding dehydrogenase [Microbacterium sp.]|uniref:zinc-binding dehydrogenase n=1 Tax=Microbacterium sp. TaxID=51671 RepID=UPI0039E53190
MATPTTTRAAVLTAHGAPLDLQELELPAPAPGAAIVRIACATLCGTDIEIWEGKMSFPGMLPMILGHEMVGEIVAVGEGTHDALGGQLRVGDRIGWSESTCGECFGCVVLRQPVHCSRRGYGFLQRTDVPPFVTSGLADYAYVSPGSAKLKLPDNVKNTWASMAGCAAKTVLRAFDRAGGVRTGSRVAIQGSGALGVFATAVAKISGAAQVITIGAPASRLELATRFGADAVVDIAGGDVVERVMEVTFGHGADHVFDFAGAASVGPEAIGMAARRGTFTIVGSTGLAGDVFPLSAIMGKELTVTGSLNGDISDYARSIEFFAAFADRYPWDDLFSAPVGLAAASEKIASMAHLGEVKAVIDPRLDAAS